MSFRDCLDEARRQGLLSEADAAKAKKMYGDIAAQFARDFGPAGSAAEAARATVAAIRKAATEKRRKILLQRAALNNTVARIEAQVDTDGAPDPAAGLLALMDADDKNRSNIPAYRQHYEAIMGRAQAKMAAVLEAFRPSATGGPRNRALLENVVRQAHGEETGDSAAKALAQAWGETAEWLRLRANAAGAQIGRLTDWGLPHAHDSLKVRRMGRDAWVNYITPLLDTGRMLDRETGLAFAPDELRRVLGETFDQIATEGWARRSPQQRAVGSALAARRSDARFLIFRNADAWLGYDARLGGADPFSAMVGHLDSMARDIAAMELFGPSPTATLEYVIQLVRKRAAELDAREGGVKHTNRADKQAAYMRTAYDIMRGAANRPVNSTLANALGTTRTLLGTAQLGKAAIGAASDLNYHRIAAAMNGLDAGRQMGRFLGLLNPANMADRRQAVRAGLIADSWTHLAIAQKRFTDEYLGAAFAQRLSHMVMNATGLSPWTQSGRWAFGMEFMGTLADHAALRLDQLPDALRNALARHGFSPADWDAMRAAKIYDHEGARFLRAEEVAEKDERLADRLLGMIAAEREYAVPSYSLRGQAMVYTAGFKGGAVQPGTVAGELMRSPFMYKSFGITLLNTHLRRRAIELWTAPDLAAKSRVAARGLDLLISSMLFGAFSYQVKQVAAGRDPKPMFNKDGTFLDPKFLATAFAQSGGVGVFSDFFFTDFNSFGRGLAETFSGPVVNFATDAAKLTAGNAAELVQGKPTHAGREAVAFARNYQPGGNIWYAQVALSRLIYDRLQLWADPEARANMYRAERRYHNQFGQDLWWRPGAAAPARAPDLSHALTEAPQ